MAMVMSEGDYHFLVQPIGPDAVHAPTLAIGPIRPTGTGDREGTVDPMTGFACASTPLGRGHIIALFLGGPDIDCNYAPQYEQWQQSGAWKRMEKSMEAFAATASSPAYMVVRLGYGRTGNQYLTEQEHFRSGRIVNWTDARIPDRFEVWRFLSAAPGAAEFLASLADPGKRTTAMTGFSVKSFLTLVDDFHVVDMPGEDYRIWRRTLIRKWADERARAAATDLELRIARDEATAIADKKAIAAREAAGGSSSGKMKTVRPRVRQEVIPRLSRAELAAINTTAQQALGFAANATNLGAWKLHNIDRIVLYVRQQLISIAGHGITNDEVTLINGDGAAGFITENLLG